MAMKMDTGIELTDEPTYQAQWSCKRCGAAGLLEGSHAFCPACGSQRSTERAYFPDWDDLVATHAHRFHGIATPCCGEVWSTRAHFCGSCGCRLRSSSSSESVDVSLEHLHRSSVVDDLLAALGTGGLDAGIALVG